MPISHPHKFGAWLIVCGFALGGAGGSASASPPAGARDKQPSQTYKVSSVIPDTTINAVGSGSALRSRKAAITAKPAGNPALPGKPDRPGKSGMGTPGKMQVAEPKEADAAAKVGDSKAWQLSHAKGLTQEQKQAFRERKDAMQDMMALIREKRMAMRDAEPEKRAALARELHILILEEDGLGKDASAAARTASEPRETEAAAEKGGAGGSRRKQAEFRQSQMEKRKEEIRKEEIRKQQIERFKQFQESKAASEREGRKND